MDLAETSKRTLEQIIDEQDWAQPVAEDEFSGKMYGEIRSLYRFDEIQCWMIVHPVDYPPEFEELLLETYPVERKSKPNGTDMVWYEYPKDRKEDDEGVSELSTEGDLEKGKWITAKENYLKTTGLENRPELPQDYTDADLGWEIYDSKSEKEGEKYLKVRVVSDARDPEKVHGMDKLGDMLREMKVPMVCMDCLKWEKKLNATSMMIVDKY